MYDVQMDDVQMDDVQMDDEQMERVRNICMDLARLILARIGPMLSSAVDIYSCDELQHCPFVQPETRPITQSSAVDTYSCDKLQHCPFVQPETRPITQEQLLQEVGELYAKCVILEAKTWEIYQEQATLTTNKLSNEQWQALIALYRTLLDEHNDFVFASQHPASAPALKRLAATYANGRNPSETQHHHRRGRGKRRNEGYWMDYNSRDDTDLFDGRECLFSDGKGNVRTPAMANLDTGLKVPGGLIMSSQYAQELGRYQDISQDFVDPCLRSISGHTTPVTGILRDVVFRLKGTSVTFKRDFFICDAIDGMVDIMFGASFIKNQFKLFFERAKDCISTFATWFSTKKESKEEKAERERRERDQRIKATRREIARLQNEEQMLRAAQRQRQEGAGNRY